MIDQNRVNGIFLTAVAFYLAAMLTQLHARQPAWQAIHRVSFEAIAAAVERGIVETAKLQGDENYILAPGS